VVSGIEPTTTGLLDQRHSHSDNQIYTSNEYIYIPDIHQMTTANKKNENRYARRAASKKIEAYQQQENTRKWKSWENRFDEIHPLQLLYILLRKFGCHVL